MIYLSDTLASSLRRGFGALKPYLNKAFYGALDMARMLTFGRSVGYLMRMTGISPSAPCENMFTVSNLIDERCMEWKMEVIDNILNEIARYQVHNGHPLNSPAAKDDLTWAFS